MSTRRNARLLWLTAAGLAAWGGAGAPAKHALAQDAGGGGDLGGSASEAGLVAETIYLKALFAERELRDLARAEKGYADAALTPGVSRDILARSHLGRARCLRGTARAAEADVLLARIVKDFADVTDAAREAESLRAAAAAGGANDLRVRLRSLLLHDSTSDQIDAYGDRAVPVLAEALRDDDPETVERAARKLEDINTDACWAAIEAALRDSSLPYPAAIAEALRDDRLPTSVILAGLSHGNAAVRTEAARAACGGDVPIAGTEISRRILADAALRDAVFGESFWDVGEGSLLCDALGSDDAAVRAGAQRRIRTGGIDGPNNHVQPAVQACPPAVLAHADSVAAIVESIHAHGEHGFWNASAALLDAALRVPGAASHALNLLTLGAREPTSADRDLFVAACRNEPSAYPAQSHRRVAARVAAILGERPSVEDLCAAARCVAWDESFPQFLGEMLRRGALDDARLARILSVANSPGLAMQWVERNARAEAVGPVALDAYVTLCARPEADGAAHLAELTRALRGGSKWPEDGRPIESWLDAGAPAERLKHAVTFLRAAAESKAPIASVVLPRLDPAHPQFESLLAIALVSNVPGLAERVERWTSDRAVRAVRVSWALVQLRGPEAEAQLAEMIRTRGDDDALELVAAIPTYLDKLGSAVVTRLLRLAIAERPACFVVTNWAPVSKFARLDPADVRAVTTAALGSQTEAVRLWGAEAQVTFRDPETWDALVAVARSGRPESRDAARRALAAIEKDRIAVDEFVTKSHVRGLMRSEKSEERRAAIAGAVATRSADLVPELLRLAVDDTDPNVRADARSALVALGTGTR